MKRGMIGLWGLMVSLAVGMVGADDNALAQGHDAITGKWTLGSGIGLLGNTVDGTAFAFNIQADRFITSNFSIGPLVQIATTSDLFQTGISAQGKYWLPIPDTGNRMKVALQGGIGFVHADRLRDDTSWLIPIGVSLDWALTDTVGITGTFLLNFTDLDVGFDNDTNVMPGLAFGLRF